MSSLATSDITFLVQTARQQSAQRGFRLPVVLSGDRTCLLGQAALLYGDEPSLLWLGEGAPTGIESQTFAAARTWLGRELDVVVINAFSGLNVDGLGAVSGTIRAGGMMILLTPPLDEWQNYPDPEHAKLAVAGFESESVTGRMLGRLARLIRDDEQLLLIQQNQPLPEIQILPPLVEQPKAHLPYASQDQQQAVETILSVLQQPDPVPLVMTADRGRGKSAALGFAAGKLMKQQSLHIGLAGPRLAAVEQVFVHAAQLCPEANIHRNRIHLQHSRLDYYAPDELIREQPELDVLFIDEAAAIPTPMLAQLLALYPRIVFSSTLHGYEGSGRGFALRFLQTLDQQAPGWRSIELKQPVRWAEGDPLEQWMFRALLLDVELEPVLDSSVDLSQLTFRFVDRNKLENDESLLNQVFSLLVWAHYQTRPQDLRNLLDGPNVQLVVAQQGKQILGALLLATEGGFDQQMAKTIIRGERRPRGHMVPQSLALHSGFVEAPTLRYGRVMRIAVHPDIQRQGIGGAMLEFVAEQEKDSVDMLCTSFGATDELVEFWLGHGYQPLRLGFSRDQASGCHSLIMAKALSDQGGELLSRINRRFAQALPLLVRDGLEDLTESLVQRLQPEKEVLTTMESQDWQDVKAFATGQRGYESCLLGLWRFLHLPDLVMDEMSQFQRNLLKNKLIESTSWQKLVRDLGLTGRKAAIKELEQTVSQLVKSYKLKG